jgi:enoyl-CoA hydratase/carnithine racemase
MSGIMIEQREGTTTVAMRGRFAPGGDAEAFPELVAAVRGVKRSPTRAVVLRWDEAADAPTSALPEDAGAVLHELLRDLEVLSVAVVSGPVTGSDLALMLACDLRVATPDTSITVTDGPRFGLAPLLLATTGRSVAVRVLLGEPFDVRSALAAGLLTHEVGVGDVDARIAALLARVPTAEEGRLLARALRASEELPLKEAAAFAEALHLPLPEEDRQR